MIVETGETSLAHHGVKGMKWGVHKSGETIGAHTDYSEYHQKQDISTFGKRSARRINNRMHAGQTHAQARKAEVSREQKKFVIGVGAIAAGKVLQKYGPTAYQAAAQLIAVKAETNRNRATNAATRGLPSSPSTINYSPKSKAGVYNITNK